MSQSNVITVPMTPVQFADKSMELRDAQGIEVTGNTGTISKHGVEATYVYDGTTLVVTIIKHPLFATEAHCTEMLSNWLKS